MFLLFLTTAIRCFFLPKGNPDSFSILTKVKSESYKITCRHDQESSTKSYCTLMHKQLLKHRLNSLIKL